MFDKYFYILFIALVFIAIGHLGGIYAGAYELIPWLDIVTHFLGGFWVGGVAIWALAFLCARALRRSFFLAGFIAAIFFGIGWEFFEIWANPFYVSEAGYAVDTLLDLLMDGAGGIAAAYIFLLMNKKAGFVQ